MSSHYLDFSSCRIVPGFCKSGHICTVYAYMYILGLGDCINFTITIIVIKTSRFPIISDFVIIWKSIAYLQFKECLLLFYSLLYVVT